MAGSSGEPRNIPPRCALTAIGLRASRHRTPAVTMKRTRIASERLICVQDNACWQKTSEQRAGLKCEMLALVPGGVAMRSRGILTLLLLFLSVLLSAQDNKVFYFPKPVARTPWQAPMKPVTRLADVKARHHGEPSWREEVVHDENTRAFLVQEPVGARRERTL